jgi:carboxylesterase
MGLSGRFDLKRRFGSVHRPKWEQHFASLKRLQFGAGELVGQGANNDLELAGTPPTWLALHGFCGAPEEMRLVVEAAASLGQAAHAPVLAGHGTHASDLAPLRFEDWLAGIQLPLARARQRGDVILVGLSLGSLLASRAVLDDARQVLGLVLLSNAFFLAPFPSWPLSLAHSLKVPDFRVPKAHADIGDPEARKNHVSYSAQPVRAAISVQRAGLSLFQRLGEIPCPTLIVHGAKDHLCPVSNAWRVAERIGRSDTRVVILPRSHHIVTRDFDRELLRSVLVDFARRVGPR